MQHLGVTMRKFLAIVFIVSATIKAGNCVVCIECSNSTSPDCAGKLATCGTCMTHMTEMNFKDGNTSYSVEKTCNFKPSICNTTYSITSDKVKVRIAVNCCNTDSCNKEAIKVTPGNNTQNGLKCPTCSAWGKENCVAITTIQCTGDERKCVVFSGKIPQKGICQPVAVQGCANEPLCQHAGHLDADNAQCQNNTMTCSDGMKTTDVL